ncbi:MAG: hypothetical protein GKR89_14535 [Candidatus Latescibacteria bacterium]|nr:hypothetical protein [Candidatus Latescibacterota bacterium]
MKQKTVFMALALSMIFTANSMALSPAERRLALLEIGHSAKGAAALAAALEDDNEVVRRTALRLLVRLGAPGRQALVAALDNGDPVVRMTALRQLAWSPDAATVTYLAQGVADADAQVRKVAIEELVALDPRSQQIDQLIATAAQDSVEAVRNIAVKALWPFYRETVFKRDSFDLDLQPVLTIPLPKDDWRFQLDPLRNGHVQDWYEPGFDDSQWDWISIEKVWQDAGYQFTGVTWYRRAVALPEKVEHLAIEMHFGGVDESAWVWLNGEYMGQHDIGPEGWNIPFALDITDAVRWGQDNTIVVRAMNTRFAGGIWKPVRIEVLK